MPRDDDKQKDQEVQARQDEPRDDGGKLPAQQEGGERTRERPTFRPRCDIMETEDGLTILADMPGARPDTLEVHLERRELSIRAEVEDHAPGEGMSPMIREYQVGDWERRFQLSGEVDTDGISAALKDGVLTVKVPRAPRAQARRIEVSAA
jgi:HSP20 family molecular chaperone IbpA